MVWSPNSGNGYPYDNDGFDYHNPKANDTGLRAANFAQLNTDNVGASADLLTNTDDPYGPYWPGDQWVDWVGLSVYNIYRDPTTRQTAPAPVDVFTNPQSASSIVGIDPIHQFYRRFVVEKNKPFIFSETGASYTKDLPGASTITPDANPEASELAVKQSWYVCASSHFLCTHKSKTQLQIQLGGARF